MEPILSHLLTAIGAAIITVGVLGLCGAFSRKITKASEEALANARRDGAASGTPSQRLDAYTSAYNAMGQAIADVLQDHVAARLVFHEAMARIKSMPKAESPKENS